MQFNFNDGSNIFTIIGEVDTGVKAQGENGKSAYETALDKGFAGTVEKWLESLKGVDGAPGQSGPQGIQGSKGDTGNQGPQGPTGNSDR